MKKFRFAFGFASLTLALFLYLTGNTHYFLSVSENFLPRINVYPAGLLALLGTFLMVNELLKDIESSEFSGQ